jgi:flavin-binding protein dodecin
MLAVREIAACRRPGHAHVASRLLSTTNQEAMMATKKSASAESGVYRVIDVIGTSPESWEEAARIAVETAGESLRDLRIAEVARLDVKIEDGRVVAFRARLQLSFKYEA